VPENNHYKTVDGIVLLLHDEDVPRSGALVTRLSKLVWPPSCFFRIHAAHKADWRSWPGLNVQYKDEKRWRKFSRRLWPTLDMSSRSLPVFAASPRC